ncbi:MAG: AAA family ATPase [Acetatifactor sp.]|nr:AAA family ATPase [Acetatifactor sp.]
MIYLLAFQVSKNRIGNPNIYPYHVFRNKALDPFVFHEITIFYGNNGSGKSTLLNLIAEKLQIAGNEHPVSNTFGRVDYCERFTKECSFDLGDDEETGRPVDGIPKQSRYVKSEDILYEIKKIQQRQVLADGMEYDLVKDGMAICKAREYLASKEGRKLRPILEFAQEKYSNGETAMHYFQDILVPDALYLLDEPEVSLSPANQVKLAEEINKMARFLKCQFIIATHSPFMLGTLNAKIYNLDDADWSVTEWTKLENVRYFYNFFKRHEKEF